MNTQVQAVEVKEAAPKRVMSAAAKAALDASRARYDLAQALLTVMENAVSNKSMAPSELKAWIDEATIYLEAEKKRKAEEAEYRRLNNQRGVGLALHREKTNAALGIMEMLKAAGLSEADIMSGKVTPETIAAILAPKSEAKTYPEEVEEHFEESYPDDEDNNADESAR